MPIRRLPHGQPTEADIASLEREPAAHSMKHFDQPDEPFTKTALNDEQRTAIAELTQQRKRSAWAVLLLAAMTIAMFWHGRGGTTAMALAAVLFWFQFYKLDANLRALKIVDALGKDGHGSKAG